MPTPLETEDAAAIISQNLRQLYHLSGLKAAEIFEIRAPRFRAPRGDYDCLAGDLIALLIENPDTFTDKLFLLAECAEILAQLMVPHDSEMYSDLEATFGMQTKRLSARVCLAALAIISRKNHTTMCPGSCQVAKTGNCHGECVENILKQNQKLRKTWEESLCDAKHKLPSDSESIIRELDSIRQISCSIYQQQTRST